MAAERTIDEIDGSILDILQYNARTTQAELSKAVGLAPSAVLERLRKLEAKGIAGLAFWDNGFHMVSANKPLLMPADFQGLKVRISGSKVADLYFRALGALDNRDLARAVGWDAPLIESGAVNCPARAVVVATAACG